MKSLTKANEDYLEAILCLEKDGCSSVKSIDIANHLSVSKPAVSKATNELKEMGLIEKNHYGAISLTNKGRVAAKRVYEKHKIIFTFLKNIGISEENAEIDCCKIEHIISNETLEKMDDFNKK